MNDHRNPTETREGWALTDARALARPASFEERGAVAPFTAPRLFGVRLRPAARGGLEVVFPNPSGREGWFVLPWKGALEAFRPSLADRALVTALGQGAPRPGLLREAARRMAIQGFAGRAARRAAARGRDPSFPDRLARVQAFLTQLAASRRLATTEADARRAEGLRAQGGAVLALVGGLRDDSAAGTQRREWLLDGWDLLAAAWEEAPEAERTALLRLAVALAPPLPLEAEALAGGALDAACSPRGGGAAGAISQELAEAALARWLSA